jgi:hypothetical protein
MHAVLAASMGSTVVGACPGLCPLTGGVLHGDMQRLLNLFEEHVAVSKESAKAMNLLLRSQYSCRFRYTSSQATQFRDPNFRATLIAVSSL